MCWFLPNIHTWISHRYTRVQWFLRETHGILIAANLTALTCIMCLYTAEPVTRGTSRCLQREGSHWTEAGEAPEAWWTGSQESLSIPPSRKALAAHWFTPTCGLSSGQGPSAWEEHTHLHKRRRLPAGVEPGRTRTPHSRSTNLQGQRGFFQDFRNLYSWKTAFLLLSLVSSCILFKSLLEHLLEFCWQCQPLP